jgi:(2R)-3-sulfolactate dehydrogenase (NADP+)
MNQRLTIDEAHKLAMAALCAHRTSEENAEPVARALVAAEVDGLLGHGLSRLPSYCQQAASGKVAGTGSLSRPWSSPSRNWPA